MKNFTKIIKWAESVGAIVEESNLSRTPGIIVELPNGKRFKFEQRESSVKRVINRGRGTKLVGSPKGLYMLRLKENNFFGHSTQQPSQKRCIELLEQEL